MHFVPATHCTSPESLNQPHTFSLTLLWSMSLDIALRLPLSRCLCASFTQNLTLTCAQSKIDSAIHRLPPTSPVQKTPNLSHPLSSSHLEKSLTPPRPLFHQPPLTTQLVCNHCHHTQRHGFIPELSLGFCRVGLYTHAVPGFTTAGEAPHVPNPVTPDACVLKGQALLAQGRLEDALKELNGTIAKWPDHARGEILLLFLRKQKVVSPSGSDVLLISFSQRLVQNI